MKRARRQTCTVCGFNYKTRSKSTRCPPCRRGPIITLVFPKYKSVIVHPKAKVIVKSDSE